MTLVSDPGTREDAPVVAVRTRRRVVLALAATEAPRMLRSPWLLAALLLTAALTYQWLGPQEWNGRRYGDRFVLPSGLYLAASLVVADSFHRERVPLADHAPMGEMERSTGRMVAAGLLIATIAAFVVGVNAYVWSVDGLDLGTEPGRTLHAYPTLAEEVQPVAVAALAVAVGALAGRRLRHRATAVLALAVGWFPVTMTYWAFQAPAVAPFSIVQSQPVSVDVGPPSTDPTTFPGHWLLEPPGEYQDHWARLVVSEPLAWWHDGWVLGLAALALALALPAGRGRRALAGVGAALAIVSAVAQWQVYPS